LSEVEWGSAVVWTRYGSANVPFVIRVDKGPARPPKVMKNTFCLATALFSNRSSWKRRPLLCHPERSREPALSEVEGDLRFYRPVLGMFFDRVLMQVEVKMCRAYGA
jgi:hypothetical protein